VTERKVRIASNTC